MGWDEEWVPPSISSLWAYGRHPGVLSSSQWVTDAAHCTRQGHVATRPIQRHAFAVSACACTERPFSPQVSRVGLFLLSLPSAHDAFLLNSVPHTQVLNRGAGMNSMSQGNWLISDLATVILTWTTLILSVHIAHTFQNTPESKNSVLVLLWATTGSQHFWGSQFFLTLFLSLWSIRSLL